VLIEWLGGGYLDLSVAIDTEINGHWPWKR
jgi:hypothetical protein